MVIFILAYSICCCRVVDQSKKKEFVGVKSYHSFTFNDYNFSYHSLEDSIHSITNRLIPQIAYAIPKQNPTDSLNIGDLDVILISISMGYEDLGEELDIYNILYIWENNTKSIRYQYQKSDDHEWSETYKKLSYPPIEGWSDYDYKSDIPRYRYSSLLIEFEVLIQNGTVRFIRGGYVF